MQETPLPKPPPELLLVVNKARLPPNPSVRVAESKWAPLREAMKMEEHLMRDEVRMGVALG